MALAAKFKQALTNDEYTLSLLLRLAIWHRLDTPDYKINTFNSLANLSSRSLISYIYEKNAFTKEETFWFRWDIIFLSPAIFVQKADTFDKNDTVWIWKRKQEAYFLVWEIFQFRAEQNTRYNIIFPLLTFCFKTSFNFSLHNIVAFSFQNSTVNEICAFCKTLYIIFTSRLFLFVSFLVV